NIENRIRRISLKEDGLLHVVLHNGTSCPNRCEEGSRVEAPGLLDRYGNWFRPWHFPQSRFWSIDWVIHLSRGTATHSPLGVSAIFFSIANSFAAVARK